jgi:hypothetical protein
MIVQTKGETHLPVSKVLLMLKRLLNEVNKFKGALHQGFYTLEEAQAWLQDTCELILYQNILAIPAQREVSFSIPLLLAGPLASFVYPRIDEPCSKRCTPKQSSSCIPRSSATRSRRIICISGRCICCYIIISSVSQNKSHNRGRYQVS